MCNPQKTIEIKLETKPENYEEALFFVFNSGVLYAKLQAG